MKKKCTKIAFTLIELLIVVAIIAILAVIALPNFLEAQTRSKVSRAKADMRTIAVATENYRIDNNYYPVPSDENGIQVPLAQAKAEGFETRVSVHITTPIAYLSSRFNEPFPVKNSREEDPQFHYTSRAYITATEGSDEEFNEFTEGVFGKSAIGLEYFVLSHGPDLDHDAGGHHHDPAEGTADHQHEEHGAKLYDPTNGTTSNGDIIYWGPGAGFKN